MVTRVEKVVYRNPAGYAQIVVKSNCPEVGNWLFRSYQKVYKYLVVRIEPARYHKFVAGRRLGWGVYSFHKKLKNALVAALRAQEYFERPDNPHGVSSGKQFIYVVYERVD